MPSRKKMTTWRLSEECRALLAALADRLGLTQTAVVEMTVREKARTLGVELAKLRKRA